VSPAFAGDKVDRALRAALKTNAATQSVILTLNPGCRATTRRALERHGDAVRSEHEVINAIAARIHSIDIDALAQSGCVKAVSADADVHAVGTTLDSASAVLDASAALQPNTRANTLRDTLGLPHSVSLPMASVPTGTGVTAAIIDSGIQPNADFSGRIVGFWDFTKGGAAAAPHDDYGHGTHIAGLIGSSGKLSRNKYQGIAPAIRLIGLKVLDSQGAGRTSDVIEAIEFVIANRTRLNIQIINLVRLAITNSIASMTSLVLPATSSRQSNS